MDGSRLRSTNCATRQKLVYEQLLDAHVRPELPHFDVEVRDGAEAELELLLGRGVGWEAPQLPVLVQADRRRRGRGVILVS